GASAASIASAGRRSSPGRSPSRRPVQSRTASPPRARTSATISAAGGSASAISTLLTEPGSRDEPLHGHDENRRGSGGLERREQGPDLVDLDGGVHGDLPGLGPFEHRGGSHARQHSADLVQRPRRRGPHPPAAPA